METINGNSVNNFSCITCNKIYKNKSGIWKHNKTHHTTEPKNIHTNPLNIHTNPLNIHINPLNIHTNPLIASSIKINKYECEYCKYSFSRSDSLHRHKLKCKIKKSDQISKDETIDNLQKQLDDVKKH